MAIITITTFGPIKKEINTDSFTQYEWLMFIKHNVPQKILAKYIDKTTQKIPTDKIPEIKELAIKRYIDSQQNILDYL